MSCENGEKTLPFVRFACLVLVLDADLCGSSRELDPVPILPLNHAPFARRN